MPALSSSSSSLRAKAQRLPKDLGIACCQSVHSRPLRPHLNTSSRATRPRCECFLFLLAARFRVTHVTPSAISLPRCADYRSHPPPRPKGTKRKCVGSVDHGVHLSIFTSPVARSTANLLLTFLFHSIIIVLPLCSARFLRPLSKHVLNREPKVA